MREAQSAAAVRSAHVVQVYDCGIDNGVPYISMELLEGESLDKRLSARGALSARELNEIFAGVAQAVDTAHELGVVHRDLKPGNIFIARERDVELAKVLDFGIAKLLNRTGDTAQAAGTGTGVMLGTPYYMSPEQVRGSRDLDQRTDLWSLAVIAFECLTGELPFRGDSVGDIIVQICTAAPALPSACCDVPPGFDEWFSKGTSKDPAGRFSSAREMAEALSVILARSPAPPDPRSHGPSERSRTTVLPPPATLPPSQSTGPMTAPITRAPHRAARDRWAIARGSAGLEAAIALASLVCAAALWALTPRRASSGLEDVRLAPASSSSTPSIELAPPSPAPARPGARAARATSDHRQAAPASGAPSTRQAAAVEPEPSLDPDPDPDLDPAPLDPAPLEPAALEPASAPTRARPDPGTSRAAKPRARSGRKPARTKAKRRPKSRSSAPEQRSEPDPFADRQ